MTSFDRALEHMIVHQIIARGVTHPAVLDALRRVPRHQFVPPSLADQAYEDRPLPIGEGQTISQPYIVALMTEALDVHPDHRVLEIGTGSGYQAAILSLLCREVITIERIPRLAREAEGRLAPYPNVRCIIGDGYEGYPEAAPYDRIILTAAPPDLPPALLDQLSPGGKLIAPIGTYPQELFLYERRDESHYDRRSLGPVIFVPMIPESAPDARE